jgi:hypothetical protein
MKLGMSEENVLGFNHTFASLGKCKETRPKHSWVLWESQIFGTKVQVINMIQIKPPIYYWKVSKYKYLKRVCIFMGNCKLRVMGESIIRWLIFYILKSLKHMLVKDHTIIIIIKL